MATDTARLPAVEIAPDDGQIARRLEELQQHIDAWLQAVRAVQDELLAGPQPEPSGEPCPSAGDESSAVAPRSLPPAQDDHEPVPLVTGPLLRKRLADAEGDDGQAQQCKGFVPAANPFEVAPESDEDEALLATLDEKTAMTIRVRRRLLNNSKSVRELLEEMRANPSPEPTRTRRWWRFEKP